MKISERATVRASWYLPAWEHEDLRADHRAFLLIFAVLEHEDLRAGHGKEATNPVEASVTVLSLECVMGHWNVATDNLFSS